MDIKQLTYFITIVEEGTITQAANKLHMAQPPLSTRLKLLEDDLGVKLIERGARKIKLTDAGKILYKRAKHILEITTSTEKEIEEFRKGIQGTLRLGTISSSGSVLLSRRIIDFNKKYPNIKFEIHEGNTYELIEKLNSGIIEVGIVRTPFNSKNFQCLFLEAEPMVAVMSESYNFETARDEILLEDLKGRPLIIYRRFEKILLGEFQNLGIEPNVFCINDDARTTILWAGAGLGIGIVPKSVINFGLMDNIKYKEINNITLRTQISAIWIKERYLSMAAKKFLEFFT
ncbi:LysR family transcriptional regulator [Clostridium sp. C2-6-12]|uniref:LysR family transcriptional regulator n=1 Tax=Clostridium sp. C2-6-12 TaxID=2698832 RepID=UPI001371DA1B|nr:LysR family transcriptional regulator [Clostridium sp. C2-6-12]